MSERGVSLQSFNIIITCKINYVLSINHEFQMTKWLRPDVNIAMKLFPALKFVTTLTITMKMVKGALSRGFRRFLAETILKLVVANLVHGEHYL